VSRMFGRFGGSAAAANSGRAAAASTARVRGIIPPPFIIRLVVILWTCCIPWAGPQQAHRACPTRGVSSSCVHHIWLLSQTTSPMMAPVGLNFQEVEGLFLTKGAGGFLFIRPVRHDHLRCRPLRSKHL